MTTEAFIIDLFCRVDAVLIDVPKHPQAKLYPSAIVTLAVLFALKGAGPRAFYRWLVRDDRPLFPRLPQRPRVFRLFATHRAWADYFLAQPTVLGVADSSGIELRPPSATNWAQRTIKAPLDRRRQAGLCGQPVGLNRRVGLRDRQAP